MATPSLREVRRLGDFLAHGPEAKMQKSPGESGFEPDSRPWHCCFQKWKNLEAEELSSFSLSPSLTRCWTSSSTRAASYCVLGLHPVPAHSGRSRTVLPGDNGRISVPLLQEAPELAGTQAEHGHCMQLELEAQHPDRDASRAPGDAEARREQAQPWGPLAPAALQPSRRAALRTRCAGPTPPPRVGTYSGRGGGGGGGGLRPAV